MQVELRGAARTISHVSFDAARLFSVDLMVEQAVQEDFSFVAVHFRLPLLQAAPCAAWDDVRKH
jgi:hypothetical protein